ncbi:septum formation initiator family protein [Legionella sp. W05-934-2]|jgi:cell division protein FtsB|uniref:septum formation initiator family protein n=1 Tax=Legionella sp. W05-934-2 TaxID=1198649 RepID=UPI00346293C0
MKMLKVSLVVLLLALQFKLWFGDTGIFEQRHTQRLMQELLTSNEKLADENQHIASEVDAIKQNQEAVEGRARSELGMVREGERFFQFKKSDEAKGA